MKLFALTLALSLTLAVSPGSYSQTTRVVTLAGDPWPPYMLGTLGEDAVEGTGVELMNRIFDRLPGVGVRYPLVPWQRALQEVEQGAVDGIGILLRTPEREKFMAYTEELFTASNLVWFADNRFPTGFSWQQSEDLAAYTVGIIRGHSYGGEIDGLIEAGTINTTEVTSVELMFNMLSRERIDLALANDAVGYVAAKQLLQSGSEIKPATRPLSVDVYYIGFSKKSSARELVPAVNKIIGELRKEGLIERIIRNDPTGE